MISLDLEYVLQNENAYEQLVWGVKYESNIEPWMLDLLLEALEALREEHRNGRFNCTRTEKSC